MTTSIVEGPVSFPQQIFSKWKS